MSSAGFGLLGLKSHVTRQLAFWSLVVGGIASLLVSAGSGYLSYRENIEKVTLHIESIGDFTIPPLVQSLWSFDHEQAKLQLEGYTRMQDVSAVRLRLKDHQGLNPAAFEYGVIPSNGDFYERSFVLTYVQDGLVHELGTLTFFKDLGEIRSNVWRQMLLGFAGHALVILTIILIVFLIYHQILRKRLLMIATELHRINLDDLRNFYPTQQQLVAAAKDELEELALSAISLKARAGEALRAVDEKNEVLNKLLDELAESSQLLEVHRNNLEQLVEVRTKELAVAKEAAETASRAKSTFLANMSHELRTPMNAIMGMTSILQRRSKDPDLLDKLNKISQASKHLLAVINDILDLSKIEADRMVLEDVAFSLGDTLNVLADMMGVKAHEKDLSLNIQIADELSALTVKGDPLRLRQILINLVGNAIKFTAQGGVTVNVFCQQDFSTAIRLGFEVIDTGIGISIKGQECLFSAFSQADPSMTRKYGGTGLGLAISKRLVELMGGEISVESAPNHGSTFRFSVQLQKSNQPIPLHDEPLILQNT